SGEISHVMYWFEQCPHSPSDLAGAHGGSVLRSTFWGRQTICAAFDDLGRLSHAGLVRDQADQVQHRRTARRKEPGQLTAMAPPGGRLPAGNDLRHNDVVKYVGQSHAAPVAASAPAQNARAEGSPRDARAEGAEGGMRAGGEQSTRARV